MVNKYKPSMFLVGGSNVGMDVASEAYSNGAESVVAVDIQKPAAFGKEMETPDLWKAGEVLVLDDPALVLHHTPQSGRPYPRVVEEAM